MTKLLILLITTVALQACIPPIMPIPPIGCTQDNAVLINDGSHCYWVFTGC